MTFSSTQHAELIQPGHVSHTTHLGGEIDIFWMSERLQGKILQDGGQEQEQLHASQSFTGTNPLACREKPTYKRRLVFRGGMKVGGGGGAVLWVANGPQRVAHCERLD